MNTTVNFIEWNEKYLVNIPEIDEAHHKLFSLVNCLHASHVNESQDKKQILNLFYDFLEYVYSHFTTEEELMEKMNYSGLKEHKQKHEELRVTFEGFMKDLKSDSLDMDDFLKFTKSWLVNHITIEDQKYVD